MLSFANMCYTLRLRQPSRLGHMLGALYSRPLLQDHETKVDATSINEGLKDIDQRDLPWAWADIR